MPAPPGPRQKDQTKLTSTTGQSPARKYLPRIQQALQRAWIGGFIVLTGLHLFPLKEKLVQLHKFRPLARVNFAGNQFAGLDQFLGTETHVGYITDRNPTDDKTIARYEQAQYMLAPVVLDLNNPKHRLLIFDCTSDEAALYKLNQMGAVPLKRNQFGIILGQTRS